MAQEDVFKKIVSHCKSMASCFQVAKFMMVWQPFTTMVRTVSS